MHKIYLQHCVNTDVLKVVLSLSGANEHRISPMWADRVQTYVDFINSPQNETI